MTSKKQTLKKSKNNEELEVDKSIVQPIPLEEAEQVVKEEIENKDPKQLILEQIEKHRMQYLQIAVNIKNAKSSWFTAMWLKNKFQLKSLQEVMDILNTLKLAGYLVARMNNKRNREEYAIVIVSSEKKKLLLQQQTSLKRQLSIIETELLECEEQIKREESVKKTTVTSV